MTNDQGTDWVLLCRKAKQGSEEEGMYNDIAMIGHNPYPGKTCYFQNALYNRTDGIHVPHPADDVNSPISPEQSPSLWSGIQGGLGTNAEIADSANGSHNKVIRYHSELFIFALAPDIDTFS